MHKVKKIFMHIRYGKKKQIKKAGISYSNFKSFQKVFGINT